MKAYRFSMIAALFLAASVAIMTGCEYDVAQPQWYEEYNMPSQPVITAIDPAEAATPGVNFITIRGENLSGVPDVNGVYFGTTPVEINQKSATAIRVRRPNLETDSCIVKVVSDSALLVAKFPTPYRIDPVLQRYGTFVENTTLSVVAVDSAENLYVVETNSKYIHRVSPNGDMTVIGSASRAPYDAAIGPDGNLYMTENNRAIDKVNLETGEAGRWTRLPSGKVVKFCDFDNAGYFYAGGTRTDLVVVPFDLSTEAVAAGFYAADEIFAIRVFSGYVYVASRTSGSQDPAKIWRHPLGAGGTVGAQELVLDMSTAGDYASRSISAMAFASDGKLYIATDSPDPILVVDPATQAVDIFYKDILPSYCKHFYWGSMTYLYMISGNEDPAEEWTVYRVDMGATSAP